MTHFAELQRLRQATSKEVGLATTDKTIFPQFLQGCVDLDKSKSENRLKMELNIHDRIFKTVKVFSDARNVASLIQ